MANQGPRCGKCGYSIFHCFCSTSVNVLTEAEQQLSQRATQVEPTESEQIITRVGDATFKYKPEPEAVERRWKRTKKEPNTRMGANEYRLRPGHPIEGDWGDGFSYAEGSTVKNLETLGVAEGYYVEVFDHLGTEDEQKALTVRTSRLKDKLQLFFSPTAISNLLTMGIAAVRDPRQALPVIPMLPDEPVRKLRASLILEEAFETVTALGFRIVASKTGYELVSAEADFQATDCNKSMEDIIDGCCDTAYVCIGTMLALGVPDLMHLKAVSDANNKKFPGGEPVPHPTIPGKYGKPEGWLPPNHVELIRNGARLNLAECSQLVREMVKDEVL